MNEQIVSSTILYNVIQKDFILGLDQTECMLPIIVRRIVYSKGGHSIKNKVNLLIKLVSLKMNREEGPAPGSTWRFFFLG